MSVLRGQELVGRVVGQRYRLLRPVGSGASAQVYVAEDVRLRRRVALKVLHPALAQDRSFQRRFQAEAQTVAALRHPGIVRVYDWGQDGDEAYLAMELLEGGSLRGLLDSGCRLGVSQAAALGLDAAAALSYAHSRGLVHRDIKPANLLFDDEGHVSVADFGIARALAEASWTEPLGALVGTARYCAPEQLQGVALDGKADVYALALVLVEAVTGEVPFALDTTIGALVARASTAIPVPAELGILRPVIEQAGLPDRALRLSAEDLAEQIASAARQLRAPRPLPLPGLPGPGQGTAGERTVIGGGQQKPAGPGLSILAGDLRLIDEPEPGQHTTLSASPLTAGASRPRLDEAPRADSATLLEAHMAPRPRRRRRWPRRAAAAAVVAVLAGAGSAGDLYFSRPPPPPPTYSVPRLTGEDVTTAVASLAKEHLSLVVTARQWDSSAAAGLVVTQYPLPGSRLLAKRTVYVTVSKGPQPVAVPSLATLDLAQAGAFLRSDGLRLGVVTRRTSMSVPLGVVISWSAEGHRLLPGRAVNVVVSAGKPEAVVPAAADGSAFARLAPELVARGFRVSEEQYYSNSVPAGAVISTNPPPGTEQVVGTTVTVAVSLGPHLVVIPASVVGLSVDQATKLLSGLGIYVDGVVHSPLAPVQATEPAVGTSVLYGSSIVLVTSG